MLYTLAGGGTLCGVAALVLLIVSTATDFWMQYRYSGNSANQGLWRFCINRKCHGHTLTVAFWDATRAFMLLSVLSCFAGVVLGLSAFANGTKNRRVRTGGIALLLSGFLALDADFSSAGGKAQQQQPQVTRRGPIFTGALWLSLVFSLEFDNDDESPQINRSAYHSTLGSSGIS
ncbi:hypothetical protein SRHO_G00174480 [Serrasalmus rhombeus]